jgi:hypothetical protein
MMAVEVETPEDYMGNVMGDLSGRRGIVQGMEDLPGGGKAIKAEVPLHRNVRLLDHAALDERRVAQPTRWSSSITRKRPRTSLTPSSTRSEFWETFTRVCSLGVRNGKGEI